MLMKNTKESDNKDMEKHIVIGYGVVGKATSYALKIKNWIDTDVANVSSQRFNYRKDKKRLRDILRSMEYFYICLPTPTLGNGEQDIRDIDNWLGLIKKHNKEAVIIVRSTVLPGTTDYLSGRHKLLVVHVPEFLNEKTALDDVMEPELLVVGCRDILLRRTITDLISRKVAARCTIECLPTTSELIKYTMNCFFALKVIFGNQIWDIAKKTDADYDAVKKALEAHKWGSVNGWDVWRGGFRGYKGKCLPKDIKAFITRYKFPLMEKVEEINRDLLTF